VNDAPAADAAARVRAALPELAEAPVEGLVHGYLDVAEPHDLSAFTAEDVAGAIVSVLRAGRDRAVGGRLVRVANPTRQRDGWQSPHTAVDVVSDDAPFLVDSVSAAIVRRGYDIHLLFHPLLEHPRVGFTSHLHLEIDRETDAAVLDALRDELASVVDDVFAAVADWDAMRAEVVHLAGALRSSPPPTEHADDVAEATIFLEWLADDNFTFVGAVRVDVEGVVVPGSELGVARRRPLVSEGDAVEPGAPWMLSLTTSLTRSTVHRDVPLHCVNIRRVTPDGAFLDEARFLGLYTANVYSQSAETIPLLRRKVAQVVERSGFPPDGHDGRALANVLETYPRDELFRLGVDELTDLALAIVAMGQRRRVRLFVSRDHLSCFVSCLVYLPRDRYTTLVRIQVLDTLRRAFGGSDVDFNLLLTESVMARLHVVVSTPGGALAPDPLEVEAELAALVRAWVDDLHDAFVDALGEGAGVDAYRTWMRAFPAAYQFDVDARDALADVAVLDRLDPNGDLAVRLEPPVGEQPARIKLYRTGGALVLSDVMPLLEHLGVTVIDERPYEIDAPDGQPRSIYSFGVRAGAGEPLRDPDAQARVAEVFLGVWAGTVENDGLNRLVLSAGLVSRDVVIVRGLCQYLRQAGVRFTDAYLADTLAANPDAVRLTVALFHQRLDPSRARDDAAEAALAADLGRAVDAVVSLDADRILRALWHLVGAVVRTNAYRGEPYLAVKLDPAALDFLPRPRPQHEIWLASPSVEGVHLRAGDIARGGIRWSDRREDFRTEILGLMKAQTVKNAVIVPVGAKGGFVVKRGEVRAAYQTFIRGLLELTDNLVDGRVMAPAHVVRHDGDDPYLVVAADKGTGSFSNVANELAAEYDYWLGDAFASGGSAGFDHKEMGITSRGVWISVRAHFRALGVDADTEPLTVVGIGDMSGDVFGNGMLRSSHLKLVAAFDHRHVLVDPDPDPAASFAERQRLFALPRSSWADYDPAVLSPGGAVFDRTAKSVTLSTEARHVLGVDDRPLTPDELVSTVLRAPVDLLWNGGIGTFVKATSEANVDVGDRTNDAVRVDAPELRCRVVAEGGNLGFTQRARIEFALAGGRINTDAIDNSAGVDCSDHEVNIKILLRRAIASGLLEASARDALLVHMTDAVAELVLADNDAQANALEIAAVEAPLLVGVHARQMERLEQSAGLDRALEALPTAKVLQERHAAGVGLTSPELAVLLAYTKLELQRALVTSDVPDDPYLHSAFVEYFPPDLRVGYEAALASHPLRREIVATVTANAVVNRAGISFLSRLCDETGLSLPVLARAHVAARDVFDAGATWAEIDALDLLVPAAVQDEMFLLVRRLVERAARWLVRHADGSPLGPTVDRFRPGVQAVVTALPGLLAGASVEASMETAHRLEASGVPAMLARRVATSDAALVALPAVELAAQHAVDPLVVARVQFVLDDRLGFGPVRDRIAALPRADRWQTEARAALRDDFYESQHALTEAVIRETDAVAQPAARVDAWLAEHAPAVDRYRGLVDDVERGGVYDLATLAVVRRALRELAALD
jgi:glutamate dehydrogenase